MQEVAHVLVPHLRGVRLVPLQVAALDVRQQLGAGDVQLQRHTSPAINRRDWRYLDNLLPAAADSEP